MVGIRSLVTQFIIFMNIVNMSNYEMDIGWRIVVVFIRLTWTVGHVPIGIILNSSI